MSTRSVAAILLSALFAVGTARADAVAELLAAYGGGPFDAAAGAAFWQQRHVGADAAGRSCATCHTGDPRQPGRHAATGKAIDPLAPSVNPRRLTDRPEIEKWLMRNCKWTLGRECTAQEKGDILTFLRAQ
jgi:mono/diheme cytochrome c family protein